MAGFGCGSCGTGLGCGSCGGMGDADSERRFPSVERVLIDYIKAKSAAGESWYLSPELNDTTLSMSDIQGLGFWAQALAMVTKVASTVGSAVVKAAPAVAQIAGTSAQIRAANAQMQSSGTIIPNQIAQQVANATKQDVLGLGMSTQTMLLVGGGLLALILLTKK